MSRRSIVNLAPIAIVVVTILIYAPMTGHEPVLDDPKQIDYVTGLSSWIECLGHDSAGWFRPVKNLLFFATLGPSGEAGVTKAACLLLFCINIFLAYGVLRQLSENPGFAPLGCALFAWNPTMVSSVQFLSACNNQISLSFILLYLRFALVYAREEKNPADASRPIASPLSIALTCLLFGLVSYEAAVTATGIAFVLIGASRSPSALLERRPLRLWFGSILVTLAYLAGRGLTGARGDFTSPSLPPQTDRWDLIIRAPYYLFEHLLLWTLPWSRGGVLLVDNPNQPWWVGATGWCVLILSVSALVFGLFTRFRLIAAGLLVFVGAMVPLANFLGLGNGPICNYYLLIPGTGLAIAVAALAVEVGTKQGRILRCGFIVLIAALLASWVFVTRHRIIAWQDQRSLNEFTLQNYPDNYVVLASIGSYKVTDGEVDAGIADLERSLQLAPWDLKASLLLAQAYRDQGDKTSAVEVLKNFITENKQMPWRIGERMAEIYVETRQWVELRPLLQDLLSIEPVPSEENRFYINVVIPYLIIHNRFDEAKAAIELLQQRVPEKSSEAKALGGLKTTLERVKEAQNAGELTARPIGDD